MKKRVKQYKGIIYQGCGSCAPIERIAPLDMPIAVGFGEAYALRDSEVIYREQDDRFLLVSDIEKIALESPNSDYRIILNAPLRNAEYQRQGTDKWVLIDSGIGFA